MTVDELCYLRALNQKICRKDIADPATLVKYMVGMQAQDYGQALWSIGSRLANPSVQAVEKAIENREIIRTWPLRSTIHFASAEDVHWMLDLIAPKAIASTASRDRQLGLDEKTYSLSQEVIAEALEGRKELTREELQPVLENAGISITGIRLSHILQRAAVKKLVCFGAKRNKEFTYTLLNDWVPEPEMISREVALGRLAEKYFASRGPASREDFLWWSGLPAGEVNKAYNLVRDKFKEIRITDKTYLFLPADLSDVSGMKQVHLLAGFDEYLLSYKDRSFSLEDEHFEKVVTKNGIFTPIVFVGGKVQGFWKRTFVRNTLKIEVEMFHKTAKAIKEQLAEEANLYADFSGFDRSKMEFSVR